ncbi:kinase-like protein [Coprinopsis marcescibilis]|uniref:Kinase-like protein n=1 Tax=Coprinopsis marcescibilis TaxID=230819 RepID=A0A5C3L1B2_COPMA|nr:kinase-like protein [Coprinopsis marcescibilis]
MQVLQVESFSNVDSTPFAHGGFADIYKGVYCVDGRSQRVAIKMVRTHVSTQDHSNKRNEHLLKEGKLWSKLEHPNVVPLFGVTSLPQRTPFCTPALVYPFYENGNLMQYAKTQSCSEQNLVELLTQAASGLSYLHSFRPNAVIHGDIKASNILVKDDGQACLTDFGLSRVLETRGYTTTSFGGTCRWMAYELLTPVDDDSEDTPPPLTKNSDVWSFGMTMLETFTLDVPYAHLRYDPTVVLAIMRKTLPRQPRVIPNAIWLLLRHCWAWCPQGRPSIHTVQAVLTAYTMAAGQLSDNEVEAIIDEAPE